MKTNSNYHKNFNNPSHRPSKNPTMHVETKKPEKEVEISDDKKQKFFVNKPYYDFIHAEEELGFSFSDFAKNDFAEFLKTMYVVDFINLRKHYISRNYVQVRFLAHKFKSPFSLFCCDTVKEKCENLQSAIDKGKFELEDYYIDVLITFSQFLNKLKELALNLGLDLNSTYTKKFLEDNEKCNQLEDIRIKAKIISDFDISLMGKFFLNNKGNNEQRIFLENQARTVCCNQGCTIF